ncbi:MAG: SAM-dependent methyltransferase [Cytophagales bacterium]|nr:SAM-dependent methyltransferase [Cytophagales bacterium]
MQIGTLYIIPTPLSEQPSETSFPTYNLLIISQIKHYLVEEVRTARRFISSLKLGINIETLYFTTISKDSTATHLAEFAQSMCEGTSWGMMSEAGCPAVADPGHSVVMQAHKINAKVVPLIGPNAIILALMASGLNAQNFEFHGYLPVKPVERDIKIKQIETESIRTGKTQIFIETPYRNITLCDALLRVCVPHTLLCVAQDLTGVQEQIITQNINQWKKAPKIADKVPSIFLLNGKI